LWWRQAARFFAPKSVTLFVGEDKRIAGTLYFMLGAIPRDRLSAHITRAAAPPAEDGYPAGAKQPPIDQALAHSVPQGVVRITPARNVVAGPRVGMSG
jgi:hypothetical protein